MTRARNRRAGERGQVVPFIAICMLGMIAFVGLTVDGGMEATHYRVAQNGVDAGALAAARQLYESNATATTSQLCDSSSGVGPLEVKRNTVVPDTCHVLSGTTYVAGSPSGFQGYGALATADENLNIGLASVAAHVGLNEVNGATTGSPAETASGTTDLAALNATVTLLGLPTSGSASLFSCGSSQSSPGTNTVPAGGTCPQSSLALSLAGVNVSAGIGLTNPVPGLIQQSNQSYIPSATSTSQPQQRDSTQVVGDHLTLGSILDLTATVGTTAIHEGSLGGAANPVGVETTSDAAHLSGTLGGLAISADNLDVGARITWDPRNGFQTTTSCTTTNITINGSLVVPSLVNVAGYGNVYEGCNLSGINLGGLLSIKSDSTTSCTAVAGNMVCTADVCFLDITLLSVPGLNSASVCLGKAHASATFKAVTGASAAITVTGHVPTPTYFVRVIGFAQTNPAATASAMPQQVLDVSPSQFTAAPYAVSYYATEVPTSDQAAYCGTTYGPLQPGCGYEIVGAATDDSGDADVAAGCAAGSHCWDGQVDTSTAHAVGSFLKPVKEVLNSYEPNIGTKYALLPVVWNGNTPNAIQVKYYGLFKLDSEHPTRGTLVRAPDASSNVYIDNVQETSDIGWNPDVEGAVSLKLVDTSALGKLGYT